MTKNCPYLRFLCLQKKWCKPQMKCGVNDEDYGRVGGQTLIKPGISLCAWWMRILRDFENNMHKDIRQHIHQEVYLALLYDLLVFLQKNVENDQNRDFF